MRRRQLPAGLALLGGLLHGVGRAQAAASAAPIGALKDLGFERYQVGTIVVDKAKRRFAVPGRVHVVGKPLEYLATSPNGMKAYETMLELDASGSEFNLACILIGLERDTSLPAAPFISQTKRLPGPPVTLKLVWQADGRRVEVPAEQALLNPDSGVAPGSVQWVYTGSPASDGKPRFAADDTGTLIGFIHDAASVIEAAVAIGVGAYGSVRGHAMLPPPGTEVELQVQAVATAP